MANEYSQDALLLGVIAGRSLDEQVEQVRKFGNHGLAAVLRAGMLKSIGIPPAKKTSQNVLMFGCYVPFSYAMQLRDYIKVLDILGVDYTYLDNEFCCGSPMIQTSAGEERERAKQVATEFINMNMSAGQKKGASKMAYFCVGCAHMVPGLLPGEREKHVYSLDLIVDELKDRKLRLPPTAVGYFEGCHTRYKTIFPDVALNWAAYRRLLDRIDGLRVVDIPNNNCCSKHPERILEAAEKHKLDTIICPCNACYRRLDTVAAGKLRVKHLPEILLQSLQYA